MPDVDIVLITSGRCSEGAGISSIATVRRSPTPSSMRSACAGQAPFNRTRPARSDWQV